MHRLLLSGVVISLIGCAHDADPMRRGDTGGTRQLSADAGATPCLPFGPDTVSLAGVLRRVTFPGPPNYENVLAGDAPETSFVLDLGAPICAAGGRDQELGDSASGVHRVQLVVDATTSSALDRHVDKPTTLLGTLFPAHTAHHRTPILLDVLRSAGTGKS